MDFINKDVVDILITNSMSTFKQDPKLVIAINKLFGNKEHDLFNKDNKVLKLPKRKLTFFEVHNILTQSTSGRANESNNQSLNDDENNSRKQIIKKVENILSEVNNAANNSVTPTFSLRNQNQWSNCVYDLDRVTLKSFTDAKKSIISYSSSEDKNRFNTIVFVLYKVHELLSKNLTLTRRELFYQNITRFNSQCNVDVAVRDVCCLLETPPWSLGLTATAKGLIAGPLTIFMTDGTSIDCMTSGGTLIPQNINCVKEFKSSAKYILVVEKDAIFQKLLDEGALIRLAPVIIITGKGYPDVCTRLLLCRLCAKLRLRALALVDADPHGYEIFLTYKYGSLAQSHLSSSLACNSLVLLGVRQHDVTTLASRQARMLLSAVDKRKLNSLLRRPYLNTANGSCIKDELNAMLRSGEKAEIEAIAPTAAALCDAYLPSKIIEADFLGQNLL